MDLAIAKLQEDQGLLKPDWIGRLIEIILAMTLIFAPLAFGTVDPWSEQVVLILVGCMAVLFVVRLILSPDRRLFWHWAYIPVFLFVLIVGLQLISLPVGWVRYLSPNTVEIKTDLLSRLNIEDLDLSSMTLSFYSHATVHDLCLILAIVTVFVIVFNIFTSPSSIKRVLTYITTIGGAVALLAIIQFITQADKIYGMVPIRHNLADGGPFVNHSHFAQFMNLSMGAAMALVFMHVRELNTEYREGTAISEIICSPVVKALWLPGLTVLVGAVSVFVSLSRGGIVSLLLAISFITILIALSSRQKGRGQIMAIMILAAFACVLYIGFDAVYERMATLHDFDSIDEGRLGILKDLTAAWSQFPLFGTGLGTHSVVYPMFNTSTIPDLASHAENEYAQTLEETGILGLMLLLVFVVFVWKAFVRIIQHRQRPVHMAAYGLGFGLLAIMIHSFSDFGQHLPANAFLSAIFCALLLRMEQGSFERNPKTLTAPRFSLPFRRVIAAVCLVVVVSGWSVIIFHANKSRIADAFWAKAVDMETYLDQIDWQGTNQQYIQLLKEAETAVSHQPGNVHYRHWLNVYRWRSVSRETDPNTGQMILSPIGLESVRKIVDDLGKTCTFCPTFGPSYCVMGELESFVLDEPHGIKLIQTSYKLAPCDATVCLISGTVDAQQGSYEEAFDKLQRVVQLNGNYFREAALLCLEEMNDPNKVLTLAGENIDRLNIAAMLLSRHVSRDKESSKGLQAEVDYALAKVKSLLEKRSQQPDAPADVFASLADIYSRDHDADSAVALYQKALAKDYSQISWHYNLARLYAEQGRREDAIHQAKICLRLDSSFTPAKELIESLVVKVPELEVSQLLRGPD